MSPEARDQSWVGSVAYPPGNSVPEPRFDHANVTFPVEDLRTLHLGQALEDRGMDHRRRLGAVHPSFGDPKDFRGDIDGLYGELEIRPARTEGPQDRIDLDADAATQDRDLEARATFLLLDETAHQF